MNLIYGIGAVIVGIILYWLYLTAKAMKDPDVQIATDLRMSIKRFRHYQRLYDEYEDFILKHGANSQASEKKFIEIFKQIDNPNEWRRYQKYRLQIQQQELYKEILSENSKDCHPMD